MMGKPKEILELEKIYGITLKKIPLSKHILLYENRNCYQLDSKGEITWLNLSGNQLTEIKGLEQLTGLRKLYLYENQLTEIKGLEQLTGLQTLDLSYNQLTEIKGLEQLTGLQELDLSYNQLSEIKGLEQLIGLKTLSLYNNQLAEIKGLEQLTGLQELDLSWTLIAEIKGLERLTQLQILELFGNKITEIKGLEQLKQLQTLNLSGNQLAEIKGLEQLKQLQTLNLSGNQLTEIKGLEQLTGLKTLWLSGNQLTEIKGLEQLTGLQALWLSGNQLTEIKGLEQLKQLQELNLSWNLIAEIKGLEQLTGLQTLWLHSNQIKSIEALENIMEAFHDLKNLWISGNPFSEPKLKEGENNLDAIRKFISDAKLYAIKFKEEPSIPLPAKVMLWGNHGVGKSTFLQYFTSKEVSDFVEKPDPESTHILQVHKYPSNSTDLPQAVFYDFGGQDYYHGLYQAFFSEDSINLLLWNAKTNKNYSETAKDGTGNLTRHFSLDYWLYQLKYALEKRKRENNNQEESSEPILPVQTYAEEGKRENYTDSLSSFDDIVDTFFVSLNKEKIPDRAVFRVSLNYLKESLLSEIEKKRKRMKFAYYKDFYTYILSQTNEKCIPIQQLLDENLYTRPRQDESEEIFKSILRAELRELYERGLVLYYNKSNLKDVVWLNPTKTVEHIYTNLLPREKIKKYAGKVPAINFEEDFGIDEHIKNLLIEEKVIFPDEHDVNDKKYIIPGYLPLSEDDSYFKIITFGFTKPDFILKFKHFIPFGLINQLICLYGRLPDKKEYWRDQLIFTFAGSYKVWIRLNFSELTIEVYISPVQGGKQELSLETVRKTVFLNIIDLYWGEELKYENRKGDFSPDFSNDFSKKLSFAGQIDEYITLSEDKKRPIEDLYISVDGKYFVRHQELETIKDYQADIATYTIKAGTQQLDATSHHIKPIYLYKNFSNNKIIKNMKNIFISYSRDDESFVEKFIAHMDELKRQGMISLFYDRWMGLGVDWDKTIKQKIDECDYMVCLISDSFLKTEYIRTEEVQRVINQRKENIIPIILRPVDWESCDFATFNAALKGQCITYNDGEKRERTSIEKDAMWRDVVKEMRAKIF
ncbi:MAG: leucine-rich repeat protein [Tannerella sp.]|jgi:internalin A|nr:leucine-rich repeat protein [Tannerella sp.]